MSLMFILDVGNRVKDKLDTPKNNNIFKDINSSHTRINGSQEIDLQ